MVRARSSVVFALCAVAVLAGCPPREVVRPDNDHLQVGGGEPPSHPAFEPKQNAEADEALANAIAVQDSGDRQKAIEAYLAVRKAYPETTAGQEALYRAGVLYFEQKDYANARKALNELVFENPLHPNANDARLKAGLSALELGAYRDAYQTLHSLAQRVEGPQKEEALRAAERAAAEGALFNEALDIALQRVERAQSPEAKDAALDEVTRLIEEQVPFIEVARRQAELSPTHPAWPILTFKLARIYYHLRDWTRLQETLEAFLQAEPNHPFAPQAREMLERSQRRAAVKPKTIGIILPMSGRYKLYGEAVMKGVKLALEGSDIEIVVKDSQGDVMLAGKAVEELVFDDGAIAILGPLLQDDARRAALVAGELGVPILTMTRSEGITDLGQWVFRNMLTNSAQAEALARYTTEVLGFKRFAILYPKIPYGEELMNEFWDEVEKKGGQIRGAESYFHDQTTFTTEAKSLVGRLYPLDRADYQEGLREINASGMNDFRRRKAREALLARLDPIVDFDAIFIPDDWRRVGLVAPALAVEDIITNACDPHDLERIRKTTGKRNLRTVTLLGTNQWSSPKDPNTGNYKIIDRGQKFVTCSIYVDGFFVDSQRPGTKKFVKAWRETYKGGSDPGLLEAIGYDSAAILRSVVEKSAPTTRADFREALANVKDFEGATGKTSFNDRREATKQLFLLNIDRHGIQELDPTKKIPSGS
ncbi:MAG: penicillin-binding protein activator [Myxococcaceae bacterium]|nr:penicillin-binding protein activator [Myxococcaceae bacterium]